MRGPTDFLSTRQRGPNQLQFVAKLNAQDRCDAACPASASAVIVLPERLDERFERVPLGQRALLFCNHHLNAHEPKLAELGASIYRKEN